MTEIKINRLVLENFKCHPALTLDFRGGNASIYGDNATGKTSIYDALTWLLFGKDSAGSSDADILKPLDGQGQTRDHDALTAVEAEMTVNGEKMTLRRTLHEVWATKRGSSEATYDGNTSEYYIDGVPCKKNLFQDRVDALVSEDTFRMLTSVSHFANGIKWQERRRVLFDLAGVMDDRQILATDSRFAPLVESMGKLSLEDYKKKLLAERKGFTGAKTELPARISECQKTIEDISSLDFEGARAEAAGIQAQVDDVSAQILALEHDAAADGKRVEIRKAELELSNLESDNRQFRAQQASGGENIPGLQRRLDGLNASLARKHRELANEEAYISGLTKKIEDARARWILANGEAVAVSTACPTCGQSLPAERVAQAKAQAEAAKQNRLDEILGSANSLKDMKATSEDRLEWIRVEVAQLKAELETAQQELQDAQARVKPVADMPDYASRKALISTQIQTLSGELADILQGSYGMKEQLRGRKAELLDKLRGVQDIISKQSLLDYSRKRIEELREDARNAAACLEGIEKMLFLMEEFTRYKTGFVEDSINGLFRLARFRLFKVQANGGVEERCDAVYDGVPYPGVNNGMKINLGIDIINTLSRAYGVRVPLFVDNAESVTKLENCDSQIIRLVVSEEDKELRVRYEN